MLSTPPGSISGNPTMASSKLTAPLYFSFFSPTSKLPFPNYKNPSFSHSKHPICASSRRVKRTGKLRYPSEKKKLKLLQHSQINERDKLQGIWRLFKLEVSFQQDPGKDFLGVSDGLLQEIAKVLKFPVASMLPPEAFTIIRKSFDARKKEPKFVYTVNMDVSQLLSLQPRLFDFILRLEPKTGVVEHFAADSRESGGFGDLTSIIKKCKEEGESLGLVDSGVPSKKNEGSSMIKRPNVAVVGSGPSGLFAALVLAEFGVDVTLIERGKAVEERGRDIGALVVRRMLQEESNFCFGEGGAGTWSDGKLVTRIGKNSSNVLAVLETLVQFGAPQNILVYGKPHLGTDRLVPLLRNFRKYLQELGVTIRFGTRVDDLVVEGENITGVRVSDSVSTTSSATLELPFDAVILAVGHSARDTYQMLLSHDVDMAQKDFAVGFRIEHPQELINSIQYSGLAGEVQRGKGRVPVADYKLAKYINNKYEGTSPSSDQARRSCYSFCMCPGGQVVLTSTDPSELCINGMSFSRRSSRWANAALVVSVSSNDFDALSPNGPLAGVEYQREFEKKAAIMGGGNFVVPVQTVTDFLESKLSVTSLPPSSYRLGVKAANLHELFPPNITKALQHSILMFEEELPGFISSNALLHGVETRTSSPVQISRNPDTYESTSLKGLYPIGEGAGYAGGIVSAAVDGMYAGFALAKNLGLYKGNVEEILGKAQTTGSLKY